MLQHDLLIGTLAAVAFDVAVEFLHRNERNPIEVAPLLGPAQLVAAMVRAARAIELTGRNDFLGDVGAPDDHRPIPQRLTGSSMLICLWRYCNPQYGGCMRLQRLAVVRSRPYDTTG